MISNNRDLISLLLSGQNPMQGLYLLLKVDRNSIVEDTLNLISNSDLNNSFKKPLRIEFKGEPGVDEGGVRKEFF